MHKAVSVYIYIYIYKWGVSENYGSCIIFPSFTVTLLYTAGRILLLCPSALSLHPTKWPPSVHVKFSWGSLEFEERKKVTISKIGWIGFSSTAAFLLAWNCLMLRALCAGALSCCSSHDLSCQNPCLFYALNEAFASGSLCRLADRSSDPVTRTLFGRCLSYRKTCLTWHCYIKIKLSANLAPQISQG